MQPRNATPVHPKGCGYYGNKPHTDQSPCPLKGKVCKICEKQYHFAKFCCSSYEKTIHAISKDSSDQIEEYDKLFIGRQSSHTEQAFVNIKIGPKQLQVMFNLNTGSSAKRNFFLYEYAKINTRPIWLWW